MNLFFYHTARQGMRDELDTQELTCPKPHFPSIKKEKDGREREQNFPIPLLSSLNLKVP